MGIWQETGLSIKLDYCNPSKEPVINNNTRTWIITTIVVKLLKTHIISDEKHILGIKNIYSVGEGGSRGKCCLEKG